MQEKSQAPHFWDDNVTAQKVMQDISSRKEWVDAWKGLAKRLSDASTFVELAEESNDASLATDIGTELAGYAFRSCRA